MEKEFLQMLERSKREPDSRSANATLALARPHSYKIFSRSENFAPHVDVRTHPLPP